MVQSAKEVVPSDDSSLLGVGTPVARWPSPHTSHVPFCTTQQGNRQDNNDDNNNNGNYNNNNNSALLVNYLHKHATTTNVTTTSLVTTQERHESHSIRSPVDTEKAAKHNSPSVIRRVKGSRELAMTVGAQVV